MNAHRKSLLLLAGSIYLLAVFVAVFIGQEETSTDGARTVELLSRSRKTRYAECAPYATIQLSCSSILPAPWRRERSGLGIVVGVIVI